MNIFSQTITKNDSHEFTNTTAPRSYTLKFELYEIENLHVVGDSQLPSRF